jgi:aromatic-L-amino-acid/L-tryptophan decarboxylase
MIRSSSQFALVVPPSYALSVFRLVSPGYQSLDIQSLNSLNQLFYSRISARNDVLLTQTQLNGIFCIRFAVGTARTNETHIQKAFDLLCAEAELTIRTFEGTCD